MSWNVCLSGKSCPELMKYVPRSLFFSRSSQNLHPYHLQNGYISDFAKIKRQMCNTMSQEAYEHIQGGTDTEHFAALVMSFLCPESSTKTVRNPYSGEELESAFPALWEEYHSVLEIRDALHKTITTIINIQNDALGSKSQPNDLNIAITDGLSLVACRFRNHATEQPPSLYYSTTAGITLNRQFPDHPNGAEGPEGSGKGKSANGKQAAEGAEGHNPNAQRDASDHGKHIIVASEPTTVCISSSL